MRLVFRHRDDQAQTSRMRADLRKAYETEYWLSETDGKTEVRRSLLMARTGWHHGVHPGGVAEAYIACTPQSTVTVKKFKNFPAQHARMLP
jgi:hypothetical protein